MRSPIRKFVLPMGYLQNISRQPGGGKLGGVLTIDVIRKAEVQSIPRPVNGTVYGDIILKPGASFVRWNVTQQSAGMNSQPRSSREGPSKQNILNFFIPLDRDSVRQMLKQAEDDEFIVLYKLADGKQKIFGHLQAPVQFDFNHTTGTNFSEVNGNNCRFYFIGPDNTAFYNGATPTPPAGAAPVIVRFNGLAIASLQSGEELNISSEFGLEFFIIS